MDCINCRNELSIKIKSCFEELNPTLIKLTGRDEKNAFYYHKTIWILSGEPVKILESGILGFQSGFLKVNSIGKYDFDQGFSIDLYEHDVSYCRGYMGSFEVQMHTDPKEIRERIVYDGKNSMNLSEHLYDMYLDYLEKKLKRPFVEY